MPYSERWNRKTPGCLILVIDQSGSMAAPFGGTQPGGKSKADFVATIVNNILNMFVRENTDQTGAVLDRCHVAVLGYEGGSVRSALKGGGQGLMSLSELARNPIRIDKRSKKEIDPETGDIMKMDVDFPVWVDPVTGGGTPMRQALGRARDLADQWAKSNPTYYPPIVVHITDGESTDGPFTDPARAITQVKTDDGNALLFNCHITSSNDPKVEFPTDEGEVPKVSFARELFAVSSPIPDSGIPRAQAAGIPVKAGSRGFIFNGDATAVRSILDVSSSIAGGRGPEAAPVGSAATGIQADQ